MRLVVAGQPHRHALRRHPFEHGVEQLQLFAVFERRGFAGGTADHDPGDTGIQEVVEQARQRGEVDLAMAERRDQRDPDTLER